MKSISCKRALVLLEHSLDDALMPERAALLGAHLERCDACRAELEAAARVQTELRALPRYRCPEAVASTVLARVAAAAKTPPGWRERWRAGWEALWRPALATAGVAVAALCIALLARQPQQPPAPAAELVRAQEEVRWALAYVAQVTTRASDAALESTVGEIVGTVIGERVVAPVTQAVHRPLEEDRTP